MEVESTSGDARGRCSLGAPELQSGDVINAGRGATVLGRTLCAPGCQQGGLLLGVPDFRCAFPQLGKDSWVQATMFSCAPACILEYL